MNFSYLNFSISEKKTEILEYSKPLYYIEIKLNDLSFSEFDFLLLKNFYCQSINIVQFHFDKWKCILPEFKLMNESDSDEEGEKFIIITKKQLINNGFNEDSEILRIYLTQELDLWKNFGLSEIKLFKEFPNNDISNCNSPNDIKFCHSSNKFDFSNKIFILNDKEEINQKLIEIMKVRNRSDLNFNLFGALNNN